VTSTDAVQPTLAGEIPKPVETDARVNGRAELAFVIYGDPKTAGSKKAFVNPKTGRAIITDDVGKPGKEWRGSVQAAAREHFTGELLRGPLLVELTFYRPRPAGHFGTGRNAGALKPSAPTLPTTRPDVLKYARAVEDALTGVVWADDAQITDEVLRKRFGEPARCEVTVRPL
jgi:Holliday junction resolvase RusA-like endonuclease